MIKVAMWNTLVYMNNVMMLLKKVSRNIKNVLTYMTQKYRYNEKFYQCYMNSFHSFPKV